MASINPITFSLAQNRNPLELASADVEGDSRIEHYADGEFTFGELRMPEAPGPRPVAILVHGGCYLTELPGAPPEMVSFRNLRPMAAALTAAGIATWNIEYRRLGDEGGGWPNTFLDVAHAADHLRALVPAHALDLSRVITIGHSSGGHLALWLAARAKLAETSELFEAEPLELTGAVNLDGPVDLADLLSRQEMICGVPVVSQLMEGAREERPERYADTSPIELLPIGVPQALFAGEMFASQVPAYRTAADSVAETIEIHVVPNAGHFVFIDPLNEEWQQVVTAVRRLLVLPP